MRPLVGPLVLVAVLALPTAAACEGLSPGDELNVADARCTLAFLVAAPDGLYFATAGHCIEEGETASNPDVGRFGVGAFSVDKDEAGQDFALIRIDPALYDKLNPAVCAWGGPDGTYRDAPGGGNVRHYGHGLLFGDAGPPTRQRSGTNLWTDLQVFTFAGAGVPGDSGSAVVSEDGRALGVLTHVGTYLGTQGTNGGTHIDQGFALAAQSGFTRLRLVLDGEDPLAVLAQMQARTDGDDAPPDAPPTPPTADRNATSTPPTGTTPATPPPDGNATTNDDNGTVVPAADVGPRETADTPGPSIGLALACLAVAALGRRQRRRGRIL